MEKGRGVIMKLNPVYQKELKTSIRSIRTAVLLFGYNGLLALFGLFAFYVTFEYESRYGGTVRYSDILQIYAILAAVEFGLVLFTVPALTAASVSGEREKQTLEILLTTRLSPLRIVLGKLASSISLMILLAFSSLPILALTFSIGGITFRDLLEFMILIIVTAIFIGSIGIFFSTLFRRTTAATVATYGTLLLIGIGTVIILYAVSVVLGLKINRFTAPDGIKQTPNVGSWILILLVNPAVSCFSMIEDQIGTGSRLLSFFRNFGTIPEGFIDIWFHLSMMLQLMIASVLLWVSGRLLNPLRKSRKD